MFLPAKIIIFLRHLKKRVSQEMGKKLSFIENQFQALWDIVFKLMVGGDERYFVGDGLSYNYVVIGVVMSLYGV
jgi:hypothetical protein